MADYVDIVARRYHGEDIRNVPRPRDICIHDKDKITDVRPVWRKIEDICTLKLHASSLIRRLIKKTAPILSPLCVSPE